MFLNGKIVSDLKDIKPYDVPFDGSIAVFPLADGSSIVCKRMNFDGTVTSTKYEPVEPPEQELSQYDRIEKKLDELVELLSRKEIGDGSEPISGESDSL